MAYALSEPYTYCRRRYRTLQFAYTSFDACMACYVRIMYITVQGVYKNSVYSRLDPRACWIGRRIVRFIHIAYKVLRDLPVCVYSLWSLYGMVCLGAV